MNDQIILNVTKRNGGLEVTTRGTGHDQLAAIEAVTGAVCPEGTFQGGSQFNVTACITVILKVVVEVELLVPSYGYCPIPPCQEYNQELCATYFELPLFPGSAPTQTNT